MSLPFGDGLVRFEGRRRATVVLAAAHVQLALAATGHAHAIEALLRRLDARCRALVAACELLARRIGSRLAATIEARECRD
jgi:hypothetical protein